MTTDHILESFDTALLNLFTNVQNMAHDVFEMVDDACEAFRKHDVVLSRAVVERDVLVDSQRDLVQSCAVDILSRLHPVARDLREVLALERISGNLERMADHAKGIAKRCIASAAPPSSVEGNRHLQELSSRVAAALRDVARALRDRDAEAAAAVIRQDRETDELYEDMFHASVAGLSAGGDSVVSDIQALFVGKSLERIGDHATNIAEEIRFMTKGEMPTATRT